SMPGRGTCFRLRLPPCEKLVVAPAPAFSPAAAAPPPPPGRVLVLDDEAAVRLAMRELLQLHGVQVALAADEQEATAALLAAQAEGAPFTRLICDIRLANGCDGLTTGQALARRFARLQLLLV